MANTVQKVIKIAENEVGYLEKRTNANLDSKTGNAGSNNYTKYWRDLAPSMNGSAWCNCFVNWCFVQAYGVTAAKQLLCTLDTWSFYTPVSAGYFMNKGQWYKSNPQIGDIIYFKNSTRICHVGIVYNVSKTKVYTIEGNTSSVSGVQANGGSVSKKSYNRTYSSIAGYGRPKYDISVSNPATTTSDNSCTLKTFNIIKGNPFQFNEIIKNIKIALNSDYRLSFLINDTVDDILLINLGNVLLSDSSYKKNITTALQQLLAWWGYRIDVTGIYNSQTKTVVKTFQKQVGIQANGLTTKDFWRKILGK